ncbi:MAG: YbjN domain-containing protein [Zoogloeaceae bacterium]|nr:YbjN domain-containing protein [Zoogloeaceae bacterium]
MNTGYDSAPNLDFTPAHPRGWHQAFASRVLPEVAFGQTDKLLSALADPERRNRVPGALMRNVALHLAVPEVALAHEAEGISVHARMLGTIPAYVFEMPPPLAPGEAHFVALTNQYMANPPLACHVLLRGDAGRTTFGRLDENGVLQDLGESPEARLEAFLAEIAIEVRTQPRLVPATEAASAAHGASFGMHNLSRAMVQELIEQAGFEASATEKGDLMLRDSGFSVLVFFPEGRKDYVTLYTCWDFRQELTAMARLECANRINTDYLFVRACIGEEGGLCLGQNIALLNGVSGKYVAMALRTYLAACREIAREHAGVLAE